MEVAYTEKAQEDITFWIKSGNKKIQTKISELIEAIKTEPFSGIGRPEALKYHLSGLWSRRINSEHRLIYEITPSHLVIISLKGHYE